MRFQAVCAAMTGAMMAAAPAAAAPAQNAGGATLTMTCHPLFRGVPMKEPTVYTLSGAELFSTAAGKTLRISAEGAPVPIGRSTDNGVVVQSWASHVRAGPIVTRNVYWQEGSKPRKLRFTETYDFNRQTIFTSGESGDTCHHKAG